MTQENSTADEKNQKKVSFLPFHAINEFMTNDYRLKVIRDILQALPHLPDSYSNRINSLTAKLVKIPGFRHSLKAPVPLRIIPTVNAFEKNPAMVAAILNAWSESKPELRQHVFDVLQSRGWELLPIDADREKLPGFITIWPNNETFEVINLAIQDAYPEFEADTNDISLMAVWLSGRLPYQFSEQGAENPE
jgi:hypothetical protein